MSNEKMGIFNKFSSLIERTLVPIGAKISGQRHLRAIRDGMICATPLSIVGGIFLIIGSPPVNLDVVKPTNFFFKFLISWKKFAMENGAAIELPFNMTMALMGLMIALGIAYSLAKEYDIDPLGALVNSGVVFLLVSAPAQIAVLASKLNESMTSTEILSEKVMALPATYLDAKGVFTAMIIGIVTVEITRILKERNLVIKMPEGVPTAITSSFMAIIPLLVNIIIFYGLSLFVQSTTGKLIPQLIMESIAPLISAVDSPLGIVFIAIITQLLWLVGLHGAAIVGAVVEAFEVTNLAANAAAVTAGEVLPHIYTTPFRAFFMIIGGSGATLALVLLMCKSRSVKLKTMGKITLVPSLFNINEPVIFGTPLVLNPILAIPFVLIQPINGVIAYTVMKMGLVGATFASVPWTTPAPIGAFLSTMDWKAPLLVIAILALDVILYYPFFKIYEKQSIKEEQGLIN